MVNDVLTPTGILIPRLEPGTDEWLQRMSASKIAAVLGLSPWESKFSLFCRMSGLVPREEQTDAMSRGHYLEPAIAAWFADQHPEGQVQETGTFAHPDHPEHVATPDRLFVHDNGHVELIECKSDGVGTGWGEPGTDEIPVYYRAQVVWQLYVLGLRRCHVAVIGPFLQFAAYVVDYDEAEAQILIDGADQFLADLAANVRPPIDDLNATYQVMRQLHPEIEQTSVEVPADLANRYLTAVEDERAAKKVKQHAAAEILDLMGPAKDAYSNGVRIAYRAAKGDNTPYLCTARGALIKPRSEAA